MIWDVTRAHLQVKRRRRRISLLEAHSQLDARISASAAWTPSQARSDGMSHTAAWESAAAPILPAKASPALASQMHHDAMLNAISHLCGDKKVIHRLGYCNWRLDHKVAVTLPHI